MENAKIPDPPQAPPELNASPVDATTSPDAGATPSSTPAPLYTPEQIDRAARSYSRLTGKLGDFMLKRRGYTPMTAEEREGWFQCWREECEARPVLVKLNESGVGIPPELSMLFFVIGVVDTRKEYEQKALAEEEAARAREESDRS